MLKKWGLKIIGVISIITALPLFFSGEMGGGIVGALIGIGLILMPEKYNERVYQYTWLVISYGISFMMFFINGFFKLFNIGTKKGNRGLDEVSNRTSGNKTIKCTRCKSLDVSFIGNDRKKFSVGKAIGGNILAGDVGTLAGFAGKKGKKNHWRCNECGTTFKK